MHTRRCCSIQALPFYQPESKALKEHLKNICDETTFGEEINTFTVSGAFKVCWGSDKLSFNFFFLMNS